MKDFLHVIQFVIALLGGWLGWFLGGWDAPVSALVLCVTIDYITGVMCAISEQNVSSEVGYKGLFRKVAIFMLVGIGAMIDQQIIHAGNMLRTAVIFYYISNEGISILENTSRLGVPYPPKLKVVLEQLKENEEGDGEDGNV